MKSFVLYVALAVLFIECINAKSLKTKIFRERRAVHGNRPPPRFGGGPPPQRFSLGYGSPNPGMGGQYPNPGDYPMPYQQSNGNEVAQSGEQRGCPAMCVRWNTVLKENGQLENTPIVKSPLVPGDTITQCPKQCDPKCCNSASQSFAQSDHSQSSELQNDQNNPPACMDGCPKACYPACRPGCCDAPRMTSMYQQSMAQQTPMMQPMPQPYVQQPIQQRETIPYPAFTSYPSQEVNEPIQARDIIPYSEPQRTPATFGQYRHSYSQPEMISQTRATIPQPFHMQMGQSTQQRSNVPKTKASIHAATCPIPCSPVCAPHCTKHCCESYD